MSIVPKDKYALLEAEADAIIFAVTTATAKHSEKADILTPWKEKERLRREIYSGAGTALPEVRRGTFSRVYNPRQPHLNSKEGIAASIPRADLTLRGAYLLDSGVNLVASTVGRAQCSGHHGNEACPQSCANSRSWRR